MNIPAKTDHDIIGALYGDILMMQAISIDDTKRSRVSVMFKLYKWFQMMSFTSKEGYKRKTLEGCRAF